jgi:hypothetical protein
MLMTGYISEHPGSDMFSLTFTLVLVLVLFKLISHCLQLQYTEFNH